VWNSGLAFAWFFSSVKSLQVVASSRRPSSAAYVQLYVHVVCSFVFRLFSIALFAGP